MNNTSISFEEMKNDLFKDNDFKAEYDRLKPRYDAIEQIIKAPRTRLTIFFVLPSVTKFETSVQIRAEAQIAEVTASNSFILLHRPLSELLPLRLCTQP